MTEEEQTRMTNLETLVNARNDQLRKAMTENQQLRDQFENLQKGKSPQPVKG